MRCDYCGWENPEGRERCVKCNQPLPEEICVQESAVVEHSEPTTPSNAGSRATVVFQQESVAEVVAPSRGGAYCPECGYPFADANVDVCPACGRSVQMAVPVEEPQPVVEPIAPQPVAPQSSPMNRTVMDFGKSASADKASMKRTVMDAGSVEIQPASTPSSDMSRTVFDVGGMAQSKKSALKQTIRDFSIFETADNSIQSNNEVAAGARLVPMDNFDGKSAPICVEPQGGLLLNRANVDPENPTIDAGEQARVVCKNNEWYIQNLSSSHTTYVCTSREMKLEAGDIVVIGNKRFIFQ